MYVGRFAPSTTGAAHPGTLMAGLIAWLAARAAGGQCWLRLENLDPDRSRAAWCEAMVDDLAWLGLRYDGVMLQDTMAQGHAQALNTLAAAHRLYACSCSRAAIAATGPMLPDGTRVYGNTCRATQRLTPTTWRQAQGALRVQLEGTPCDPVVRRRDGSVAYVLACVVDDAAMGITDIVRGRDLAQEACVQRALGSVLGLPLPRYWHHLLLLEPHGGKLAKLHGSLPASQLRNLAPAEHWVGALAHIAGLQPDARPTTPAALVPLFAWHKLRQHNCVVTLQANSLAFVPVAHGDGSTTKDKT